VCAEVGEVLVGSEVVGDRELPVLVLHATADLQHISLEQQNLASQLVTLVFLVLQVAETAFAFLDIQLHGLGLELKVLKLRQ